MNVLALLGSPRKHGNTATLLQALLDGLAEGRKHSIREVFLQGLDIHPCRNCDACRKVQKDREIQPDRKVQKAREIRPDRVCAIEDDMHELFGSFSAADLVVFATPIYWWSVSAQLKLFIDRLYALDAESHPERFRGKQALLLFTHYEEEPCSGADLAASMFAEIADYTDMRIVGDLRYSSGHRHVRECPEKLAEARTLGRNLGAA
jgi:multimeric flavodoxin WrbA